MSSSSPAGAAFTPALDHDLAAPIRELITSVTTSLTAHAALPLSALQTLTFKLLKLSAEQAAACLALKTSLQALGNSESPAEALVCFKTILRSTGLGRGLDGSDPASYIGVLLVSRYKAIAASKRLKELLVVDQTQSRDARDQLQSAIERAELQGDGLVVMTYWGVTVNGVDQRSSVSKRYLLSVDEHGFGKFSGKLDVLLEALGLYDGSRSADKLVKWSSVSPWTHRSNPESSAIFVRAPILGFDPSQSHGTVAAGGFAQAIDAGELNASQTPGIPPAFVPHPECSSIVQGLSSTGSLPSPSSFKSRCREHLFHLLVASPQQ